MRLRGSYPAQQSRPVIRKPERLCLRPPILAAPCTAWAGLPYWRVRYAHRCDRETILIVLGQQLAESAACGCLELSRIYGAIIVGVSSLKPLIDHRKVLVLAQGSILVWISGRKLTLR